MYISLDNPRKIISTGYGFLERLAQGYLSCDALGVFDLAAAHVAACSMASIHMMRWWLWLWHAACKDGCLMLTLKIIT